MLPKDSGSLRFVESTLADIAGTYGFHEMRTPVFEHTELFSRGVGDSTDVVQKEMYTFNDKGGRSLTLRPEGTAGAMRAFLEHGLFNEPMPLKIFYQTSCYRYEKPQAGRLREFHQFGAECFGTAEPSADAELIDMCSEIFSFFGLTDKLELRINSIGCPDCRAEYSAALKEYFTAHTDMLCDTCKGRLQRNPMRILDCKDPQCAQVAKDAPVILDYLCDDCRAHFDSVKQYLDVMGIKYVIDPRIVRGLDYYTRTVFEFVSSEIGAQGTVCGGGRYDGLAQELGGPQVPALGFAMGMERFMLMLELAKTELPEDNSPDIYIVSAGKEANLKAAETVKKMREEGITAGFDISGRSVKAQMKYADKSGAQFTAVIGSDEMSSGKINVKRMDTGDVTEMELETLPDEFEDLAVSLMTKDLADEYGADLADVDLRAALDKFGGKF